MPESATVLDTLIEVREYHDGTLSLRCSCRSAICGSCAMRINGRARLACKTQVKSILDEGEGTITVEPAGNMPVIKDLVVDMAPFWDKVRVRRTLAAALGPRAGARVHRPERGDDRPGRSHELHHVRRLRFRLHRPRSRQELPRPGRARQGLALRRRPARRLYQRPSARATASRAACGTARAATCASTSAPRTSSRWTRSSSCVLRQSTAASQNNNGSRHTLAFVRPRRPQRPPGRVPPAGVHRRQVQPHRSALLPALRAPHDPQRENAAHFPHKIGGVKHVKRIIKTLGHKTAMPPGKRDEVGSH